MYYPEHSSKFLELLKSLKGKKVAVLGHIRPDGDCIGSQVALCRVLRSLGADATAFNADAVPRVLKSFVGDTPLRQPEDDFDPAGWVAVSVDCADAKRVGDKVHKLFPKPFLNVDHHISNQGYAEHDFVVDSSAATAEILAGFFLDTGCELDATTAQALYLGIVTDTGQFMFPSTTAQTFAIASALVNKGAQPGKAGEELYQRENFPRLHLLKYFLESLKLELKGKVCIGCLALKDYRETGASREESEGFVDFTRSIEGVQIGIFLEEREGAIKASLRAKDPLMRVDQFAQTFGGGGHACAAGFNVESTLESFYPQLLKTLENHLDSIGTINPTI
tara:strand:+ start:28434 stop:29438 length:1005 start_codon:yes stop_codon:yes gene_type:complete